MPTDRPWYRRPIPIAILILIVIATVGAIVRARRSDAPAFETVAAARRDVVREVRVTGTVAPASEVALAFDVVGRVVRVSADVGDVVRAGAALLALDARDAYAELARVRAALATARADLAELRAGKRPEEIAAARVDVENARRAVAEAEAHERDVVRKGDADLAAIAADAPNALRDAYAKADDAVRKQTDDFFVNDATDNPTLTFQTSDYQAKIDTETLRWRAETTLVAWLPEIRVGADVVARDAALASAVRRLSDIQTFLDRAAAAVQGATNLSSATVTTYKANVHTGRTNVNTARTAVEDLQQAIAAQVAANASAVGTARADAVAKRNALAAAESQLALTAAPATVAQVEAQEARVAAAVADVTAAEVKIAKTVLRAPFAGVITAQDADVGETVSTGVTLVRVMSASALEMTATIPEVDIADVAVGASARVTLDAYGDDVAFPATVTAVDPAATVVDGVPTYRTTFAFTERDPRVRVGMTANVTIAAARAERVIAIPLRSVITRDNATSVRRMRGVEMVDQPIRIGLRGSDGFVEVLEGLAEGDVIVRSPAAR